MFEIMASWPGLLLGGNQKKEPGVRKSLVLLFGRLLMTLLFLYVGWVQVTNYSCAKACNQEAPGQANNCLTPLLSCVIWYGVE